MHIIQNRGLFLALFFFVTLATWSLHAADAAMISTALAALPMHRGMAVILGVTTDQALALAEGSEFTAGEGPGHVSIGNI